MLITAADLETTLITRIKIDSSVKEGNIALPAKILTDTLKEFSEQPIKFNIDPETLNVDILTENGKYSVMGQDAEDFPELNKIDEEGSTVLKINSDILLSGINKTLFATADDDLRPVMNGIFIHSELEQLTFVASDAHKLVRYSRTDVKSEKEASFILHKKPAGLLKNILTKEEIEVTLTFDTKYATFELPEYTMHCCLIDGQYPSYQSVIPTSSDKKLIVDRVELYNALRRVSVFSNQASNLVKLAIKEDVVEISAQDIDYSISAYEVVRSQFEGENFDIGFKAPFMIEILASISTSDVVIELSQPGRAGIFLPFESENENEDVLMLLMPMMLSE